MGTAAVHAESAPAPQRRLEVKQHIRDLIERGALRRGSRLPSILDLARSLDVAKNTVIAALDELAGEGVLEARERQGFFVRSERRRERARATRLTDLAVDRVAHGMATILVQSGDGFVTIGSGTAAESVLATPEWSAALKAAPPRDPRSALRYADPMGEPPLREVIAARFGGADQPADRVIVTHGAVEALNHTFAVAAQATGSRRIATESPGYFMLGPIIEALGLEIVPIPRAREGLDMEHLRREMQKAKIAALMVNPNHQNPIGTSLSLGQRFELARLADDKRFYLIEDDVYRGLWIDEPEPPTIHSLLPQRTLYVGSFSKTLGPALRTGFVLAPDALVEPLRRRCFLTTLTGDAYLQRLIADFVDRRGYQRHLAEMREELSRRSRIAAHQAAPFDRLGRFHGPYTGGLFWRFEFADGVDAMRLYRAAREENVLVSPGWFFRSDAVDGARADAWMRVNVSCCEGGTLTQVLELLRNVDRRS
jgi:DNA-binding transcriptional MocR family regulator